LFSLLKVVIVTFPSGSRDTAEIVTPMAMIVSIFSLEQHHQCHCESAFLSKSIRINGSKDSLIMGEKDR
jgi:hypothetical protein